MPIPVADYELFAQNHAMSVRIEAFRYGESLGSIPFESGTITATLTSQVNRNGSFVVPRTVYDAGLLDPLTDHVIIYTGIEDMLEVPIFTGRVDARVLDESGRVNVSVVDYSAMLIRARFEQPWPAIAGGRVLAEIERIIKDVDGSYAIQYHNAFDGINPVAVWEEDRGQALDDLATSINCVWQSDRTGGFVVYPNPYIVAASVTPVGVLRDGADGNITSWTETTSREHIANSVTVVVERTDNSPPIRVTARDTNVLSKTFWGGPFGKQNIIKKLSNPLTEELATLVAFRLLNQSLALARSWQITTPHFPLYDPGDVAAVVLDGEVTAQVIESITYPLRAIDQTTFSTRQLRQEGELATPDVGDLGI
ncbi:MAG TPA: hypothetical protein VFQ06_04885 [Nitrospira sp.]|nr:hypothetical protein [Nitrospira sp.]